MLYKRLRYSVNILLYVLGKQKLCVTCFTVIFTLLCGLELNLQYLQGISVVITTMWCWQNDSH